MLGTWSKCTRAGCGLWKNRWWSSAACRRGVRRVSCSAMSPVPLCWPLAAPCSSSTCSRAPQSGSSSCPLAWRGAGPLAGWLRAFPQTPSSGAAATALPCQMPWNRSMSFVPSFAYVSLLIYDHCRAARVRLSRLPRPWPACVPSVSACQVGKIWGRDPSLPCI